MIEVYIKIEGLEAFYAYIEMLPKPTDTVLIAHGAYVQGDKPVPFLKHEPERVLIPIQRILYMEILKDDSEEEPLTPWRPD